MPIEDVTPEQNVTLVRRTRMMTDDGEVHVVTTLVGHYQTIVLVDGEERSDGGRSYSHEAATFTHRDAVQRAEKGQY